MAVLYLQENNVINKISISGCGGSREMIFDISQAYYASDASILISTLISTIVILWAVILAIFLSEAFNNHENKSYHQALNLLSKRQNKPASKRRNPKQLIPINRIASYKILYGMAVETNRMLEYSRN